MFSLFVLKLITFIQVICNILSLYFIINYYDNIIIIIYLFPMIIYFLRSLFDEPFRDCFPKSNLIYGISDIIYSSLNVICSLSGFFIIYLSKPIEIPDIVALFPIFINMPIISVLFLCSLLVFSKYKNDIKDCNEENISLILCTV